MRRLRPSSARTEIRIVPLRTPFCLLETESISADRMFPTRDADITLDRGNIRAVWSRPGRPVCALLHSKPRSRIAFQQPRNGRGKLQYRRAGTSALLQGEADTVRDTSETP